MRIHSSLIIVPPQRKALPPPTIEASWKLILTIHGQEFASASTPLTIRVVLPQVWRPAVILSDKAANSVAVVGAGVVAAGVVTAGVVAAGVVAAGVVAAGVVAAGVVAAGVVPAGVVTAGVLAAGVVAAGVVAAGVVAAGVVAAGVVGPCGSVTGAGVAFAMQE